MGSATRISAKINNPTVQTRGEILRLLSKAFREEKYNLSWTPGIPMDYAGGESESGFGSLQKIGSANADRIQFWLLLDLIPIPGLSKLQVILDLETTHSDLLKKVGQNISTEMKWDQFLFTNNENEVYPVWKNLLGK